MVPGLRRDDGAEVSELKELYRQLDNKKIKKILAPPCADRNTV
jgi:hypothetical protein